MSQLPNDKHGNTSGAPKFLLVKPKYDFFPVGLSYVASTLERAGIPYDFVDCAKLHGQLSSYVKKGNYFAAGTGGLVSDLVDLGSLVEEIKQGQPDLPCILGGLVTTGVSREVLFKHVPMDFAVAGEAEVTLPALLQAILAGKRDFADIDGLMIRAPDGEIVCTAPRQRIDPAQGGIFPSFDFIETVLVPGQGAPVLTGRGCSGSCTFCMPMHRGFKPRDFDEIFTEIETLIKRCKISVVQFLSEVVFAKEDDIIRFFQEYKKRIGYPFTCMLRLDVDPCVLEHIRDAGCISLGIGVESGSDRILRRMGKGIVAQRSRDFVKEAERLGIRNMLATGWMVNNELETAEDIEKTMLLHEELNIRSALSYTIPYPGTAIYKNARRKGLIPDEYNWLVDINKLNYADFLTDFLFQEDTERVPFFPNLTDMPQEEFTDVLLKAAARVYNRYTLQGKELFVRAGKTYIKGNCPICGLESEFEISRRSPLVRNLMCPNTVIPGVFERTCYNDYRFSAHVFSIPVIARHAAEVDARIASAKGKIGIAGDSFIMKFLVGHQIFSFSYRKVAAVSPWSPGLVGKYVFSLKGLLPGPDNTRFRPMKELVALNPEYILVAEMPPQALRIRKKLIRLGYEASRVLLMTPEKILDEPAWMWGPRMFEAARSFCGRAWRAARRRLA